MMKSYLIAFCVEDANSDNQINNLVLVHANSYEDAIDKIKKKREDLGLPLPEETLFKNATIE